MMHRRILNGYPGYSAALDGKDWHPLHVMLKLPVLHMVLSKFITLILLYFILISNSINPILRYFIFICNSIK